MGRLREKLEAQKKQSETERKPLSLREKLRAKKESQVTVEKAPEPEEPSYLERAAVTVPGRMVQGMARPLVGAAQAGASIGDALAKPIMAALDIEQPKRNIPATRDPDLYSAIASRLKAQEAANEQAAGGIDVAGILGEIGGYAGALPSNAATFGARRLQDLLYGLGLGAVAPSTEESGDYLGGQAGSAALGGILGPLFGGAADVVTNPAARSQIIQTGKDFINPTQRAISTLAESVDQGKLPQVIQAAQAAARGETLGQAAARTGDTGLPALEKEATKGSAEYANRLRAQDAARERLLKPWADEAGIKGQKEVRDLITGPMRKQALERADIAAPVPRLAREIENQKQIIEKAFSDKDFIDDVIDSLRFDEPATSSIAGMRAEAGQMASDAVPPLVRKMKEVQALTQLGNKPLLIGDIVKGIDATLQTPKAAGLNTRNGLNTMKQHLLSLADQDGVIPAESLYQVRKTADDFVETQLKGSKSDRASTQATVKSIKGILDDAIETASGGGWKDYLETYAQMSHVIDRMRFMEGVRRKMVPAANDTGLARLPHNLKATSELLRDPAKLAKKVNEGVPIEVEKLLDPTQLEALNLLKASIADRLNYEDMAKIGRGRMADSLGPQELQLKGFLSRPISVANKVLGFLSGQLGEKTAAEVERLMLDPQAAALVLSSAKPKQLKILFDSGIPNRLLRAAGPAVNPDS